MTATVALGRAAETLGRRTDVRRIVVEGRDRPSLERAIERIAQDGDEAQRWNVPQAQTERLWRSAGAASGLRDLEAIPESTPIVLISALDEPALPFVARHLAARSAPLAVLLTSFVDGATAQVNDAVLAELQRTARIHRVDATRSPDIGALIEPAARLLENAGPDLPPRELELAVTGQALSLVGRGATPLTRPHQLTLPMSAELVELANVVWVRQAFRAALHELPPEAAAVGDGEEVRRDLDEIFDPLHAGLASEQRSDDRRDYEHIEVHVNVFEKNFEKLLVEAKRKDRKVFERFQSRSVLGIDKTWRELAPLLRQESEDKLEDLVVWSNRMLKGMTVVSEDDLAKYAAGRGLAVASPEVDAYRVAETRNRLDALGVPEDAPPSWVDLFKTLPSMDDCARGELRKRLIVEHQLRPRVDAAYDEWRTRYQRVMRLVAERMTGAGPQKSWGREAADRLKATVGLYWHRMAELDRDLSERVKNLSTVARRADPLVRAVSSDEAELVTDLESFPLDAAERASIADAVRALLKGHSLAAEVDEALRAQAADLRARGAALPGQLPGVAYGRLWSALDQKRGADLDAILFGPGHSGKLVRVPEQADEQLLVALRAKDLRVERWAHPVGDAFGWTQAADPALSQASVALELGDVHELDDMLLPSPAGDTSSSVHAQIDACCLIVAGLALGELTAREQHGLWRIIDEQAELTRKRAWLPTHAVGCIAAEDDGRADFHGRLDARARARGRTLDLNAARILHGFVVNGLPPSVLASLGIPSPLAGAVALGLRHHSSVVVAEAMDRHRAADVEAALDKPLTRPMSIRDLKGLGTAEEETNGESN